MWSVITVWAFSEAINRGSCGCEFAFEIEVVFEKINVTILAIVTFSNVTMAKSSPCSNTKSDDLAISTFDIFEMKMSNVTIVKSPLLVFKKGDDLAIVTFEMVTIAKSSHLFPQTLPQSQTQTQAKKTHY